MKFRKSISQIFLSYMIIATVLPLIITGVFTISRTYKRFEEESKQIHDNYIENQKTMLKYEVGKIVFYISKQCDNNSKYETLKDKKIIQDKMILDIVSLRFGKDGYFFGSTLKGDPLFSNGKITTGSKNILDLTDPNGVKIIQLQKEVAQNPNGGFTEYFWPKLNNEELFPKLSFTISIPEWEWIVGAGVYVDDINKVIGEKKILLKKQLGIDVLRIAFGFIIILFFLIILAKHFSIKIRNSIEIFLLFFNKSETESVLIKTDDLHFPEFKALALSANRMIVLREKAEDALRKNEIKYRSIFESLQDIYYRTDTEGIIVDISPSVFQISGYEINELIGKHVKIFYVNADEYEKFLKNIKKSGRVNDYAINLFTKDNKIRFCSLNSHFIVGSDGEVEGIEGIIRDITKRKKEGEIQKVLYNVSHVLNTANNIQELYVKIREYLGTIIDTTNFYIALYDKKNDLISLPFDIDEKDNYEVFPAGKTITKYIINTGKPLLATKDVINELTDRGLIETVGAISEIWLGVPLKIENKVIGVIVAQSYEDPNLFSEKDIDILTFISEEIALVIKHKQAEEELKINRERLKIANSILRHDIANDLAVIISAMRLYKVNSDMKMLDEIKIRTEKSLNTIHKQRDYEQFMDSHATLSEYDLEKVTLDCIKNHPDIKVDINGTGIVYADNAIYSIFENIISNAIRHGKTAKLNINIRSDKEFCEIRFTDFGIGIPDDVKFKIFDEGFHYGETGNTGIGLYIVQQTINDYGGKIFVEDNEPNGAIFVIKLRKTMLK